MKPVLPDLIAASYARNPMRRLVILLIVSGLLLLPEIGFRALSAEAPNASRAEKAKPQKPTAVYTEITLPQLGKIKCKASHGEASVSLPSGAKLLLPFYVYRTPSGRFVRAEFIAKDSIDYSNPIEKIERALASRDEQILSLVKTEPRASWVEIVSKLSSHSHMVNATRISVTLVNYRRGPEPPTPLYLVHVFGAGNLDRSLTDREELRRIRFIFDANGRCIVEDNLL